LNDHLLVIPAQAGTQWLCNRGAKAKPWSVRS